MRTSNITGNFIGTLEEKALKLEKVTIDGKNGKKIQTNRISGNISLATDNGTFTLNVFTNEKKNDGTDNKMYASILKLNNDYVVGQKISAFVGIGVNDYVGKADGEVHTARRISVKSVKWVSDDVEATTDFEIDGYINAIKDEVVNDAETGRKIVDVVSVNYFENAEPLTIYVPEDLVDDFEDIYSVGDTALFYVSMQKRRVGGSQTVKKSAFGRKATVSSGYDKTEIIMVGGEAPYDEDDDDSKAYKKFEIKTLMKNRELYLESLANENKKPQPASVASPDVTPFETDDDDDEFNLF